MLEQEDLSKKDNDLICCQIEHIAWLWVERRFRHALPFLGKLVHSVYERRIEMWLWGQSGFEIPRIPLKLTQELGSFRVRLKEFQDGTFELVGVKRLSLECAEVLKDS